MSLLAAIEDRNVTEVLHFTTHLGLIGIIDGRKVKSRTQLGDDDRLEFILKLNAPIVKDEEWMDYVNLSISRINTRYFRSSENWHPEVRWRILSFSPNILTDDGVYFVTTNNAYSVAKRDTGTDGFEAMFAQRVRWGHYGSTKTRTSNMAEYFTTCDQAEVLYPTELSLDSLQRLYVATEEEQDEVYGVFSALNRKTVDVLVEPTRFRD